MSGPRTVSRSRVVGAVLSILLVTVAAVAYRLSETCCRAPEAAKHSA